MNIKMIRERFLGNMEKWAKILDSQWRNLPESKQRRIIYYFFLGYVVLTLMMMISVVYQARNKSIVIRHIENPILKRGIIPESNPFHQKK